MPASPPSSPPPSRSPPGPKPPQKGLGGPSSAWRPFIPQQTRLAASWAVLGALGGILAAGAGAYWLGHVSGREGGFADGYRAALGQNAAAAWGNTPAGKLALSLDQAGDLHALAECARPGWSVEIKQGRRVCFVRPDAKGTLYGWALP